jgi:Skp family chaperone for outer membrane proteins
MQIFRVIVAAMLFAGVVTTSASGQTRPGTAAPKPATSPAPQTPPATSAAFAVPATKIAFIDTTAFGDEKTGVTRYVNAVKGLQREFQPKQTELTNIQNRLNAISEELRKLNSTPVVDPKSVQARQDEGERLQRDLKYKKDQADADFTKRYQEVVGPISTDIGKAIDQFALQHGVSLVLDVSKLAQAVLTLNPAMDATQAFIVEYNKTHP